MKDNILEISYDDLIDLLNEFQIDGLNAYGNTSSLLMYDSEEISNAIKRGIIKRKS